MRAAAVGARIRIVIADDHALYRKCLGVVMILDGDIEVVGEAGDGHEAVALALSVRPDVVVIDNQMPRLGGIDAARAITDQAPDTRVLMLTMSELATDLQQAVEAGVSGYVLKDSTGEEVAEAVRAVHRGQQVLPPHLRRPAVPLNP
ncbi:MAG: response regulator transcription factor [Dermatophilaceae bacterium]|nr:response regulator transcription factor [Intrasporangiaceae bacterium]